MLTNRLPSNIIEYSAASKFLAKQEKPVVTKMNEILLVCGDFCSGKAKEYKWNSLEGKEMHLRWLEAEQKCRRKLKKLFPRLLDQRRNNSQNWLACYKRYNHLDISKVSAGWVAKTLTLPQKKCWVELAALHKMCFDILNHALNWQDLASSDNNCF